MNAVKKLAKFGLFCGVLALSANVYADDGDFNTGERTLRPYAVGSLGGLRDGVTLNNRGKDTDARMAGMVGAGVQFNDILGAEAYYQGSAKHNYVHREMRAEGVRNNTFGVRATVGSKIGEKAHVFGKAGVALVKHEVADYKKSEGRATAGVGASYDLTENVALRADYDHYFKRSRDSKPGWKNADYFGAGVQYNF